jgi:sugar transferase (PEP-CTERM system associated)
VIRFLNVYYPTRTVALLLCEAILVSACFFGACFLLMGAETYITLFYEHGLEKITAVMVLVLMLSYYFDLYEPQIVSVPYDIQFRILLVIGFTCFLLAGVVFLWPEFAITGNVYPLSLAFLVPALIFWRKIFEWVVNLSVFSERVFVMGSGEYARSLVETIQSRRDVGMKVLGWQDIDPEKVSKEERKAIWTAAVRDIATEPRTIDRIIVALENGRGELPVEELLSARFRGIAIEKIGDLRERLNGKIPLSGLLPSALLYSDGFRVRQSQQLARQIVSTIAAAIGLLIFLPFFPFVVLTIRLTSKGPIFFKQVRVGVNGRHFSVYKFRSMFTDAESGGARWAVKNDPRVTGFGMLMRKTRIDEVPQLWNVLKGDMGFVGPRPERPEFLPYLIENLPFYELRHLIRPGLTGWAQVRYGYGATLEEAREKLEYDLYYIKHMSLGLDLLIMFETVKTIIRRRGAQ